MRLTLIGDAPKHGLGAIADALEARVDDPPPRVVRIDDAEQMFVELHSAAPAVELRIVDGALHFDADTSTAGPGYYRHVSALATALPVTWHQRAPDVSSDALETAFLAPLQSAAEQILKLVDDGVSGFALLLPTTHRYVHDQIVATPFGPRDAAWLRAVASDPRDGTDVFAWWSEARDAEFYRQLALQRMWAELRWREPIADEERTAIEEVVTWVERAHGLDPEADLPWVAQSELFELIGEDSLRATRAHVKAQARHGQPASPIGYRRSDVRVALSGGWWMTITGGLAERWEDRQTWVGWDKKRTIWFTSVTAVDDSGVPSPDRETTLAGLPSLGGEPSDMLELENGPVRGLASFIETEEDGERLHRLEAHAAEGHHAAIGTLVFTDPDDRDWALATWASLERKE